MYNRIIIAGNLGRDPELRYPVQPGLGTGSGDPVANLSVATNEVFTDREGQRQERTIWWRVAVWGKQAEACNQYLGKGRQVLVEGRMNADPETGGPRVFTRQDGSAGAAFEITAQVVRFLGGRGDGDAPAESAGEAEFPGQSARTGNGPPPTSEDDIPF